MPFKRIVLITKKTPLQHLLDDLGSLGQVQFYLSSREEDIASYQDYDNSYKKTLSIINRLLSNQEIPVFSQDVSLVDDVTFRDGDLVIATGPDGLCINIAKYLTTQPLLGINPDRTTIDGVFVRYSPEDLQKNFKKILNEEYSIDELVLAKVTTNEGQEMYAVNDFFVGRNDQKSAFYKINFNGREEKHSSSGLIISAPAGSTGWLKSIMETAFSLAKRSLDTLSISTAWNSKILTFVVREAFPSRNSGNSILFGRINSQQKLVVISEMPEGGVIFSDGMVDKYIKFNSGLKATFTVADKTVNFIRLI